MLRGIAAVLFGMILQFTAAKLEGLHLPGWAAAALGLRAETPSAAPVTNTAQPVRQEGDGEGPFAFRFSECGPLDGAWVRLDPDILLSAAAESLGLTTDELRAELEQGRTLGEVAGDRGVSRDGLAADLEDAALADYQARLDEAVANGELDRAEADERLQRLAERDFSRWLDLPFFMIPPFREAWPLGEGEPWPFSEDFFPFDGAPPLAFPSGKTGEFNFSFSFGMDGADPFTYQFNSNSPAFRQAAAEALGMTEAELASRLDGGESLAEIASAQGVEPAVLEEALREALVADASVRLEEAVASGDLTQAQADKILEQIEGGMRVHWFGPGEPLRLPGWLSEGES
jgi:hypothetical protein